MTSYKVNCCSDGRAIFLSQTVGIELLYYSELIGPTCPDFGEITQNYGHYAVQGHRFWYQWKARMPLSLICMNNSNLSPILHRLLDITHYWSNFGPWDGGTSLRRIHWGKTSKFGMGKKPETFRYRTVTDKESDRRTDSLIAYAAHMLHDQKWLILIKCRILSIKLN